ncbi:hypothetical protein Bca4012_103159 [Brassica carinata]
MSRRPGALSSDFGQPRAVTHGDQLPPHILERMGTTICDTQADVPSPEGLGRNLRSKTRWFTDSAIHTKYRISPRSSSMREPRYPLREHGIAKRPPTESGVSSFSVARFQETNVLSRTRIASSHRHNISASEIPANILFTFASSAYFMQRRKDHKCRLLCSRLPHGRSIREQHFKQSLTIPSR